MQLKLVVSMLGKILMIIGLSMSLPLLVALVYQEADFWVFLVCMPLTTLAGAIMFKLFKTDSRMRAKDGFAIVTFSWVIASVFGALPYMLWGVLPSFIDAFFETMSGFTTTGASVINDIEVLPHGILLWRCLTQWLGGMGIVVLFIALLSGLGAGGMHIFKAEVPGPVSEKIKPRVSDSAKSLWLIYLIFTFANFIALMLAGMNWFDAICHSFSTIATGGFSTKNASIGYYDSTLIDFITSFFMFISAMNFALYYYVYQAKSLKYLIKSKECRLYSGIVLAATLFISVDIFAQMDYDILQTVRLALFQVVSVITTTGFITYDYELWPTLASTTLIFLLFIGGCAGSTSGGIKVDRWMLLLSQAKHEIRKSIHPRMVTRLKINAIPISENIIINVGIFFFLYMIIVFVATILIAGMGIDFMSAFTSVATCIGNVGPGFGALGPTENFSGASYLAKIIYSFLMLLGRLELYTVLVIITPSFIKR